MGRSKIDTGPAVDPFTKLLRRTSVSALTSFSPREYAGCFRRWWYKEIGGKKEPETKATAMGGDLHEEAEGYLTTGEDALSLVMRAGKHLMPVPNKKLIAEGKNDLIIEQDFGNAQAAIFMRDGTASGWPKGSTVEEVAGLTANGVPLVGYIDCRHNRGEYVDGDGNVRQELQRYGNVIEVVDWKALDVETHMFTTNGWKTMGTLEVGDFVFAPDGNPTRVTFVSPIKKRPCFSVTFDDDAALVADGDHLWEVYEKSPGGRIKKRTVTTNELLEPKRKWKTSGTILESRMATDIPAAINSPRIKLPVDPYVMGAWLGDGHKLTGRITFSEKNGGSEVPNNFELRGYHGSKSWRDKRRPTVRTTYYPRLSSELREAGFIGLRSIPDVYLGASKEQRFDLLKGLLDTDGSISKRGQVAFDTIHKNFAVQVVMLARSLGYRAILGGEYRASINGVDKGPCYRVFWEGWGPTFGMSRKQKRIRRDKTTIGCSRRWVKSVKKTTPRRVRCIAVEHKSHCYVAGKDFVVTHNTTSDIGLYSKSADDLKDSIQMRGYAVAVANTNHEHVDYVRISHVYFQTRGPRIAKKVTALVSVEESLAWWAENVDPLAAKMAEVATIEKVEDVEPTLASCSAYRGCGHRDYCPKSPKQMLSTLFPKKGDRAMSLLSKMSKTAPAAATGTAAAPAAETTKPKMGSLLNRTPATAASTTAAETTKPKTGSLLNRGAAPAASEKTAAAASDPARLAIIEAEKQRLIAEDAAAGTKKTTPAALGKKVPVTSCKEETQYMVDCEDGAAPRRMKFAGISKNFYFFTDDKGARVKLEMADDVWEAENPVGAVTPPDAPVHDDVDAAAAATPEMIAAMAPEDQEKAKTHAAAVGAKAAAAEAAGTPAEKSGGRCEMTKIPLGSMDEVAAEEVVCICGKKFPNKKVKEGTSYVVIVKSHNRPKVEAAAPASEPEKKIVEAAPAKTTPADAKKIGELARQAADAIDEVVLYVDAIVARGSWSPTPLEDYYGPMLRDLEKECGAADIRCGAEGTALAFGKWKGVLAACVRAEPPAPGVYSARSGNEIAQVVIEAISPMARVIQGVK